MTKSNQSYPTDLNDIQYSKIEQYLPTSKQAVGGRPRKYNWRAILNALLYIVKNGCTWRALPKDFPPWQTVYGYFRWFERTGLWEKIMNELGKQIRRKDGKEDTASLLIMDSQSAKSAEGGEQRGFDAGKKVNGRKRALIVDNQGWIWFAHVTAANKQEVHIGKEALTRLLERPALTTRLKKILADGGYRGELVDWVMQHFQVPLEIVLKPGNQKGFQVLPKRWVVERTNAWISRQRRLARDYERLTRTSEAFIHVAMIGIGLRRIKASEGF